MKRKIIFLVIFILGLIITFNITNNMLVDGFDTAIGMMKASDRRAVFSLISLFGLIGYFVEVILERISVDRKIDKENS